MTSKKSIAKVIKFNKERKSKELVPRINELLKDCTSNELMKIWKEIKHTHLKNANKPKNKEIKSEQK